MRRRLCPHRAAVVVAAASRPPGDLMELPHRQQTGARPVVLAELREQHRADRDVHAHAERVGAADQLEQTFAGEPFDEQAVAGQQAAVMDPDPGAEKSAEVAPERGVESEAAQQCRRPRLLVGGEHVEAHERLGRLGCGPLGEVHHVDGREPLGQQLADALVDRRLGIVERQRNGSLTVVDPLDRPSRRVDKVGLDPVGVAERGRHQQEPRVAQFEQGHLPRPATVALGEVVELVHRHVGDGKGSARLQHGVPEDLGRAADDRCVLVDACVAGDHAHGIGAERGAQVEELLGDERLDRRRVHRTLAARERGVVRCGCHERLA